jgi:CheY-like chemotaxis protein
MNLITNAAESFGDEQGVIVVRTSSAHARDLPEAAREGDPREDFVLVEVTDSGTGMDEDTKRKIFEPFFTTKFTGRGLGLAAVSGIVRSHGGYIQVQSVLGHGSTFRVFLPSSPAAPQSETDLVRGFPGESLSGLVLVVDDEPAVREVVSAALEAAGLDVLSVASGAEAIECLAAEASPFCLAIIDMTMPGLNGLETARALRAIQADLPVILSSGYSAEVVNSDLSDSSFLHKPYDFDELRDLVRSIVFRRPQSQRTRAAALAPLAATVDPVRTASTS